MGASCSLFKAAAWPLFLFVGMGIVRVGGWNAERDDRFAARPRAVKRICPRSC